MFSRLPAGTVSLRYYHSSGFSRPQLLVRVRGLGEVFHASAFDAPALIDTGADKCCFPADVARHIGIDLKGIPSFSLGTVGQPVTAWEYQVTLEFPELGNYSIRAPVWFVDNPNLDPIIGREPLLSLIQLGFRQSHQTFYILAIP